MPPTLRYYQDSNMPLNKIPKWRNIWVQVGWIDVSNFYHLLSLPKYRRKKQQHNMKNQSRML
jgi:hypothetical protein